MNSQTANKSEIFFSVVIPVFNRGKLLLKTLQSLKNQSLNDNFFEIIVIDDGSSEKIEELVYKFNIDTKSSIRYYFQKNSGPAAGSLPYRCAACRFI